MGRPRFTQVSDEVSVMLQKAQSIASRLDALDMKKGEHHKATTFDTRPGGVQFMSETGGQTYNAQYQTNQSLLDSDDVANKGARRFSVNLDALAPNMNPHESATIGHLTEG